jgi:hypothetical protein
MGAGTDDPGQNQVPPRLRDLEDMNVGAIYPTGTPLDQPITTRRDRLMLDHLFGVSRLARRE